MMPQMTGMDLHAAMTGRFPEQAKRVVFVTGGAFTARAREFLDQVPNQSLEKPVDGAKLLALIASLRAADEGPASQLPREGQPNLRLVC